MEEIKFTQIYKFVILITIIVLAYLFCVSFMPINADNKDNVKTILIFLLGYLSANGNYLTGGNPAVKKQDVNNADTVNVNN